MADNNASEEHKDEQITEKTPVTTPTRDITTFQKVERATAWILILSAILFALVGISAIWGAFGDNGDVVWRSLGSLAVIALASLVINVGARMAEGRNK
jgi:cytochrome b subunit of formate dehydrogenase